MHGFKICLNHSGTSKWLLSMLASSMVILMAAQVQAAGDRSEPSKAEIQRMEALYKSIQWQDGPCNARLGNIAEIKVPQGYRFTDIDGARKWAELSHNVPNPNRLGVLVPTGVGEEWTIVFSYEDSGHVPDDEKGKLDASAILESIRQGTEDANNYRRSQGWEPVEVVGWKSEPAYEDETQHLVWALRTRSSSGEGINYNTRILGRTGVMSANLLVGNEEFNSAVPLAKNLLSGYSYLSGSKYAEWRSGDKIAQYGLTGLITGGLMIGAAKMGLLSKLGMFFAKFAKVIIIGVIALGAGIAKFLRSIFGGGSKAQS